MESKEKKYVCESFDEWFPRFFGSNKPMWKALVVMWSIPIVNIFTTLSIIQDYYSERRIYECKKSERVR